MHIEGSTQNESRRGRSTRTRSSLHTFLALALGALAVAGMASCAEPGPRINRVQANLVDKSIFEGEWWFTKTVIDLDDDGSWAIAEAGAGAPWPGGMANFDIASDMGSIGRIRWVIDESFLYAYRSHEIVRGAAGEAAEQPDYRGQPLAVFAITSHVDVRQEYSAVTGEPTNVISESSDRRWYDRQYMRVDWSQNLVSFGLFGAGLEIEALFATFRRESVPFFVQEGHDALIPEEWRPQFVRVGEDPDYRFAADWPTGTEDTVHYMSFVTQELWTPLNCPDALCRTSIAITSRNSFLRVPPDHDYAAETLTEGEYDRFGIIRGETRTYVRGGEDYSANARYCADDSMCPGGRVCNLEQHICVGGLTDEFGETDFLTFHRLRHNFYLRSLTDRECSADWQCNNRYGHDSSLTANTGSVCDPAAHRCTIPIRDREIRPVHYTLSAHYPRHLVRSAFEVVGEWNEAFMRGNRMIHGQELPSAPAVACQGGDPASYCFCNGDFLSPEVDPATRQCAFRFSLFESPADQEARGVVNPFRCHITGPADVETPSSYDQYGMEYYGYKFEGDECMLILDVNSCDAAAASGGEAACEQLGDIRYQFFNYATGAGAGWCGVMQPMQDPVNGEAILSPINMGGLCLDNVGTTAVTLWPVLRGEISEDAYLTGEHVRGYFGRLGNVQRQPNIATGADDYETGDGSRPALPLDLAAQFRERMERLSTRAQRLQGVDGRAQIFSDRIRELEGTSVENRLLSAVGSEALGHAFTNSLDALVAERGNRSPQDAAMDPAVLDRISPFRDGFMSQMQADLERERVLERNYIYMPREAIFNSRFNEYWAEAFRGRPLEEAMIRWRQAYHKAVMLHELGHGLGLEHNFAASYDRNHYQDGYYRLALAEPLPVEDDFDTDRNGLLTGEEVQAFYAEERRVRDARALAGAGNTMTSSTMDYSGDLSDLSGLGHYDHGAVWFNYFNVAEAFIGDPRERGVAGTSLAGLYRSDTTERTAWSWYRGGESCTEDAQCPFSGGSPSLTPGQAIRQRCLQNPRYNPIPTSCGGAEDCICSGFDVDFEDYRIGVAFPENYDRNGDGRIDFYPATYLFCSNSRLNDISWCNVFDAGESFRETIDHFRRTWTEGYPRRYFRNYQRGFASGSRAIRYIIDAAKIYQHLFFRYFYEPGFEDQTGPLGFEDQFQASIDSMHWLAELAQLPDVGSYAFNADTNVYDRISEDLDAPGADFSLAPGAGYHMWSRYQDGLYGYFRMERAGVFWDKLIALRALTIRDWGLSFTVDERFFINFYDLFPTEMTELFGGYIINDDRWFAPRVDLSGPEPIVQLVNYYRGRCILDDGSIGACRDSNVNTFPGPAIGNTSTEVLRIFAAIYALAEFPVYYDTTWEQRLSIFKLDSTDGFVIPDYQRDGSITCGYGGTIPGSAHADCTPAPGSDEATRMAAAEDANYIMYQSNRLSTTYIAVKAYPDIDNNLEEEQLGFQLLFHLSELQAEVQELETSGSDPALLRQLQARLYSDESFLDSLIEVQRIFGITSIFD